MFPVGPAAIEVRWTCNCSFIRSYLLGGLPSTRITTQTRSSRFPAERRRAAQNPVVCSHQRPPTSCRRRIAVAPPPTDVTEEATPWTAGPGRAVPPVARRRVRVRYDTPRREQQRSLLFLYDTLATAGGRRPGKKAWRAGRGWEGKPQEQSDRARGAESGAGAPPLCLPRCFRVLLWHVVTASGRQHGERPRALGRGLVRV